MNWRIKALAQKLLSVLPAGTAINDWLQRSIGGLRHLEEQVRCKVINDWMVLVGHMWELQTAPGGLRYVEIGTGWYPALPVCFFLAGANTCTSFDLTRHLRASLSFRMLDTIQTLLPSIAECARRPLGAVRTDFERVRAAKTLEELLRAARVEYRAPADATSTGLATDSVDVVYSNSVLEHVPAEVIRRLFSESRRILRPGGLCLHSVNCGDHYAYFDPRIPAIHYLRYSENRWRFWNSRIQFQNRLRPQDFLALATEAGLKVLLAKHSPRTDLLAILPRLQIAPEFRQYPPEQLCCTSLDFVAQKTP